MTCDEMIAMVEGMSMLDLGYLKRLIESTMERRLRESGADGTLSDEERNMVVNRDLIGCVKSIRNRTGLGLAEAKSYMDRARGVCR